MVGAEPCRLAPARLPGWLDALTLDECGLRAVWMVHRDHIRREAAAARFTPAAAEWFDGDLAASGEDVRRTAWSHAFCREWGY